MRALLHDPKLVTHLVNEVQKAAENSPIPNKDATVDVLMSIIEGIFQDLAAGIFDGMLDVPIEDESPTFIHELANEFIEDSEKPLSKDPEILREHIAKWVEEHKNKMPWYEDYSKDYVTHVLFMVLHMLHTGRCEAERSPEFG